MDIDAVRSLVRSNCEKAGSMRAFARKLDVSVAYISDVLNGHRDPGPSILEHFGLEKVTSVDYRKARA